MKQDKEFKDLASQRDKEIIKREKEIDSIKESFNEKKDKITLDTKDEFEKITGHKKADLNKSKKNIKRSIQRSVQNDRAEKQFATELLEKKKDF